MKKKSSVLFITLIIAVCLPMVAYANMAAPADSDIGSTITFEKNDVISVSSEVLDITVQGSTANIVATYKMKNTANDSVSTPCMFLSPNIETSGIKVVANQEDKLFTVKSYVLNYDTRIETTDWQYAVLTGDETTNSNNHQTVDTITFNMDFLPNETYDVVVSYTYKLGGYPNYDFDAKNGSIDYYLIPAAMWKDFSSLTINLYLNENMPIIKNSNLDFKKIKTRTYQYTSDTLPKENMKIIIDENWWQNIFSTLKSPYLPMTLMSLSPLILIIISIIIAIVVRRVDKKRSKS